MEREHNAYVMSAPGIIFEKPNKKQLKLTESNEETVKHGRGCNAQHS